MKKTTIIHKYAVAPLLAIAAMHAAVWLGSKTWQISLARLT